MAKLQNTDKPHDHWINEAFAAAKNSLCIRDESRIGAVAVKDNKVISSGHNGAVGKIQRCAERGHCIRRKLDIPSGSRREVAYCICAEQRMICHAARRGISLCGAVVYTTHTPCAYCVRLMLESGIIRAYYKNEYPNQFVRELCAESGFELVNL